jgi:outer membrane protein TolC
LLSQQASRAAEADHWKQRSALLPNVTARTAETVQQTNLRAFGFPGFPGVPSIVGPLSVFDARVALSQSAFDLSAWRRTSAAAAGREAAGFSYQDARETVVWVVANLYFQAIAGTARVEAARSELQTAEALFRQATDFKNAGVVAAIEVLRAQVEYQAQQQRLIYFENQQEKQKLDLARAIGLPAGQAFRLADALSEAALPALDLAAARDRALAARRDYQSLQALVREAEREKQAAQAQRLPKISLHGDYGAVGRAPGQSHGTFSASASLEFPLFQGGRVRGDVLQADVIVSQRRAELDDLRGRVEYELQVALLDLKAAEQQVEVARSARELAAQQMTQAQDRFAAGVVSNIEVVQAQESLAAAHENYISSLYALNAAKASLALALGAAETGLPAILRGEMP